MNIINKVKNTVCAYKMLAVGDDILIALSGGPDSVFLTHALLALKNRYNLTLTAVHINHGLRGAQAFADEAFARRLCEGLELAFVCRRADVARMAREKKLSVEEAGRFARYTALNEIAGARNGGQTKIATGHNLNDSAETVIFNLARGTSLSGVRGIAPVNGAIIRPLIELEKNQITQYLDNAGFSYVSDKSNDDLRFSRNAVRKIVIPALERHVNSAAAQNINRLSRAAAQEDLFLNQISRKALESIKTQNGLSAAGLCASEACIARRAVVIYLKELGLKRIDSQKADAVLALKDKPSGKRAALGENFFARRSFDDICFIKPQQTQAPYSFALTFEKPVFIKEAGCTVTVSEKSGDFCVIAKQNAEIFIRNRREGDTLYFARIGKNGAPSRKKLKKLLIEKRFPAHLRDALPLLAQGNDVLWVQINGKHIFSERGENEAGYGKIYLTFNITGGH